MRWSTQAKIPRFFWTRARIKWGDESLEGNCQSAISIAELKAVSEKLKLSN